MKRAISTPLVVLVLLVSLAGCQAKPKGHPSADPKSPADHTRRDLDLDAEQEAYLGELAERADRHPDDYEARKASGLAHMNFTLAGVLRLRERAEQDLEAAFALEAGPRDRALMRSLGRFYNMRAVEGDTSKAQMQVTVYSALLGDQPVEGMNHADFVAHSFFMLGRILAHKDQGKKLQALALVETLERQLADRVQAHPDNIELRALAGNFSFFFAGNIPLQRQRRVGEAVAYFEVLRARWDQLRPGARDPEHCPNTYENFMFELAEGYMVLEQREQAREIYDELVEIRPPQTRAKELIAHVSAERLRNLDAYLGQMRLMPPWPSDVGNCVVCHSWTSDVPLDSLHSLEQIRLSDIPSKAQSKPLGNSPGPVTVTTIASDDRLPPAMVELLGSECGPCHLAGGEAVERLDLGEIEAVLDHAAEISGQIHNGQMPPSHTLSEAQDQLVRAWAAGL